MSERVDLREFIGGFVAEADELVAAAHALLVELDAAERAGTTRPRALSDLFRALHTVKGLAGMIGVEPIVELAHALETLVRNAEKGGGHLRRDAIELAMQAVQAIGERVRSVADDRPPAPAPPGLLAGLAGVDIAPAPPAPANLAPAWDDRLNPGERQQLFQALRGGARAWTLTFAPSEDTAARGLSIAVVRTRLGELGELIKVVPRAPGAERRGVVFDLLLVSRAAPERVAELAEAIATTAAAVETPAEAAPASTVEAPAPAPAEAAPIAADDGAVALGRAVVRVELARLDDLQEQLSLLITSRLRLVREVAALAERGVDVTALRELAELQARQLRELRRAILRARLVRVAEVLEPLALLVRSLTRPGHKEVRLELDARDAEVDKAVADRILPALIHLVRNAVDHAIEPVDERVAAGKDRAGTLRVTCASVGSNQLELIVSDDGRGVDRDAVARRARRVIAGDDELLEVLTTPGFSTRDVATLTSGRGLGMDIVKRVVVTELGGTLAMTTIAGRGTSFTMRLPLTIAVVDVLWFECGPQAFVVPVSAVEEIFEIGAGDERRPPAPDAGPAPVRLVERRGAALPVVSLGALLAIDGGDRARKALVIRRRGKLLAFAVDRMLGRQEVVVRQLADPLLRAPGIAGATDLGDGRPTVVLDLFALGEHLGESRRPR